MITVTQAISDILKQDEIAQEALNEGLLNLSAYAQKITPLVEKLTFKEVQKGTIVVALSRIVKQTHKPSLKPAIKISNIGIKSSLCAVTYEKTLDVQRRVSTLNPYQITAQDLYSVTEGVGEITLICTERASDLVTEHMGTTYKQKTCDLVAVSFEITSNIEQPNILYTILSTLAAKRIALVEVVSTYQELSLVVNRTNMEETLRAINIYS